MRAATFLYIDYGASPYVGRELRYSLATLLAELPARVVIYTDKPRAYESLHASVAQRELGGDLERWTRGGDYNHRIKPCVLANALSVPVTAIERNFWFAATSGGGGGSCTYSKSTSPPFSAAGSPAIPISDVVPLRRTTNT